MKRKICLLLAAVLLLSAFPAALASTYSDVPEGSWAAEVIQSATAYGLMEGVGDGQFGYGRNISREEFVTILGRMFGWEPVSPETASFADVSTDRWSYSAAETALANGALAGQENFYPDTPITREDMAVMLVRALGYETLASNVAAFGHPFTDVTSNVGYITIAYDIGMINGMTETIFAPAESATREQAAAMLVRVYEKYISETEWLHGFYASRSYDQRYVTQEMDAVSFGWSVMRYDAENGVRLQTDYSGGNDWAIPESYELIVNEINTYGVKAHLNVYMDTSQAVTLQDGAGSNSLRELLGSAENRSAAVARIMEELAREYEALGASPYSGVTIDFEGIRAAQKNDFTAFLTELSNALKASGMTLYVCVQPALADGVYFDGFDYRAIGRLADKVILMAHDYNATSLVGFEGTSWHKTTALTPISSVYYSLKAITDAESGVEDPSKIALAICFASVGWEITDDGLVKSGTRYAPAPSVVYTRMQQPTTVKGWSEEYRNPYIIYETELDQRIFLWYEDDRSVSEKIELARLFGINSVSVWRIGTIPDYSGVYDVWSALGK